MSQQDNNIWEPNAQAQTEESVPKTISKKSAIEIDFRRLLSVWPWALAFAVAGFLIGFLYLRYAETTYSVSTSVIIEEDSDIYSGRSIFSSSRDPVNNKIAFFRSPAMVSTLVDTLGLRYKSVARGKIKDKDYYGLIKWQIVGGDKNANVSFKLKTKNNGNGFTFHKDNINGESVYGVPFEIDGNIILVDKVDSSFFVPGSITIDCFSVNPLYESFTLSKLLQITPDASSNIIKIVYSDKSSDRAINVLDGLIRVYNYILEKEKSKSFSQAITFIDNRIIPLGRELDSIQVSLANYKSSKGFIGNSANGPLYMSKVQKGEEQLAEINRIKSNISMVERFIQNPEIPEESLVLMGISDPILQGAMRAYQEARRERNRVAVTQTANNPTLILLDKNLREQRNNLDLQMVNYKSMLANTESNYQSTLQQADALLRATPMEEKELIDRHRMLSIKENLFLSLLQKKEEASINKASVTVNTKVLYPPTIVNSLQSPDRSTVLSSSILAGLLLPFLFALVRELLNNKIISKKQLQGLSSAPVIGELEETEQIENSKFIIDKNKRSIFGEQLRSIRTNLNFFPGLNKKTAFIMLTSNVSGEGKTFISMNLAKSYALQGKRVALLEFDLRRPKISKHMNIPSETAGLSNFLIGKCEAKDIIVPCSGEPDEHLDLFVSGPVPPNPQELISGPRMEVLRKYLEDNYEMIIIDTSPYGMVADAQILGQWADITLVVTRHQQTTFDQINDIAEWHHKKSLPNIALILNGVRDKGYFGNRYGYYSYRKKYGYGYYTYGYGYVSSSKKKVY